MDLVLLTTAWAIGLKGYERYWVLSFEIIKLRLSDEIN